MDVRERALLATTLGRLAEVLDGPELSKSLEDFGFAEVLAEEPREAVSALFVSMGTTGSMSGALQDVLRFPLSAAIEATPAPNVVLPSLGGPLAGTFDGKTVSLRGILLGHRASGTLLAPVAALGGVAWVELTDVPGRSVAGLDPALGMAEIAIDGVPGKVVLTGPGAARTWDAVAAAGRRALGYQILGAVGTMIELAVAHAKVRTQFGRPVGSFQAVRHRLADAHVAREGAAAALDMAWEADDECLAGMLAKSLAGRAARIAATECQQVLAGIGFTAEHSFHRFLARAIVLDRVLGSAAELPAAIGARLVAAGAIPRLVQL